MNPNLKYVYGTLSVLGLLFWVTVTKSTATILGWVSVQDRALIGSQFSVSTLVGLLATAGVLYYMLRSAPVMEGAVDIVAELKRVTWPERQETFAATIVVIVTVCIMSVILGFFDFTWKLVTDFVYR